MHFLSLMKRVLVVAAHPDDEMLGCGGTLARLAAEGNCISILLLGEGPTARQGEKDARKAAINSAFAAAAVLGIARPRLLALPDNRFDTVPLLDITQHIEETVAAFEPDVIFTHHAGDMNKDHRITHQAVMTACRPLPGFKPVTLLGFEVPSSTEYAPPGTLPVFFPHVYVHIAATLSAKQTALAAYAAEMRPWPHPRSHEGIEHLARLRGAQCGCEAAEAFMLYRSVL